MKRLILVAALLASGIPCACADTDVWTSNAPRSDSERVAANNVCDEQWGAPQNQVPTSRAYNHCMARQGWKFVTTRHDDTCVNWHGMNCHPILNGIGSECDSF